MNKKSEPKYLTGNTGGPSVIIVVDEKSRYNNRPDVCRVLFLRPYIPLQI